MLRVVYVRRCGRLTLSTSTIEISRDLRKRLEEISSSAGVTLEALANAALTSSLENMEDAKQAEEIIARLEKGEETTIPWKALEAELGLDR
jgi:predicted DNA-binding protein